MTLVITHSQVAGTGVDTDAIVDGADWDANHVLTGVISPAQGGTGIVNNDASTITISGSFGITFTVTATTSLTLPTSGTILAASGLTDNALLRADGTTGVQGSDAILDDSENLSAIGNITGKAGGITITGGTGSGDDLRITSTSNATKGTINLGNATTGIFFDETNERISLGADDQNITVGGSSFGIDLSIHNNEAGEVCQTVFRYASNATRSACWWGARARGSIGGENIVQADDRLVLIQALGYDGVDFEAAAQIIVDVDGTPGSNDMPGRMVFLVTPDGSATPVEAFRIQQNRDVLFASGSILTLQNTGLHLLDTDASHDLIVKPGSNLTADRTLTVTTSDADLTLALGAGGTVAYTGSTLAQFAATTSAQLAGVISDETGSGALVFATSPTLVTPVLGVATATSVNKVAITAPASSATLTLIDGTTLTGPAASGTAMTLGNTETVTGVKTFGSAGAVGRLKIAGTTSGSTVLDATAVASGTLTLPAATDTLVGKATTDTFTNKTFDTAGTGNSFSISGAAVTTNTGTGAVARASSPVFTTPELGVATATSINGVTLDNNAWSTWVPTVSAQSGTFTTLGTVTARYKQLGKTIFFYISIPITTNGTAAGYVQATLPSAAANTANQSAVGRENSLTGKSLGARIVVNTANLQFTFYDATYPGADGANIAGSGQYEIA